VIKLEGRVREIVGSTFPTNKINKFISFFSQNNSYKEAYSNIFEVMYPIVYIWF